MDDEYRHRAERRRKQWQGGRARDHFELDEVDITFWRNASPDQRLEAAIELTIDAWTLMRRADGPKPSLSGPACGIRKA